MTKIPVILLSIFILSISICGCRKIPNEYAGLEYRGGKELSVTSFSGTDTIYIEAGPTSLEGQWIMLQGKLLFLDHYMVGVREYDIQGNFISKHIERGRGPNEMLAPAYVSTVTNNGNLFMLDGNWRIYSYDSLYKSTDVPYQFLSDIKLDKNSWMQLLLDPDPGVKYMYEYYPNVKRVKVADSIMIMPIITEHVRYNGYETRDKAKKFWKESYNFIFIDLKNNITGNMFGSYPSIYRRNNIPVFSKFDFDIDPVKAKLYVGFAADSLIYVRDLQDGNLLYSFGCATNGISDKYPSTKSFEEYETVYKEHTNKYGYYTQLVLAGNYMFREYKKEGDAGYGLQIYRNDVLIGDIGTNEQINVIGEYDGLFYGILPADLDNECFRILKFAL